MLVAPVALALAVPFAHADVPRAVAERVVPLASDRASGAITGGLPPMTGITPSRAELPGSAFTKLDADRRGFVTREQTRALDGFGAAFDVADGNADGRLDAREFARAWEAYGRFGEAEGTR